MTLFLVVLPIQIRRIRKFLAILDPDLDPLVRDTEPELDPVLDPSIVKPKSKW
jgi:hypothetical protein